MKKIIFNFILLMLSSYGLKAQLIQFQGKIPNSDYNQHYLKFDEIACKNDSIIGFNDGYCSVSFNRGKNWELIDFKKQLVQEEGHNYSTKKIDVFIKDNDVIIYVFGKFFVSKDFGRHFKRISNKKSLEVADGELGSGIQSFQGYVTKEFYFIRAVDGLYRSKDCNTWQKLKTPEGVIVTNFTSYNNEMYIASLKNIYKSNDNGISWNIMDEIVFKKSVDFLRNYNGFREFKAFNNKLYIHDNVNEYVYDLIKKNEIKLDGFISNSIKNDTLFLLKNYKIDAKSKIVENGKIFSFKDSLVSSNIDISGICEATSHSNCGTRKIYINSDYVVLDTALSITRSLSSSKKFANLSSFESGKIKNNDSDIGQTMTKLGIREFGSSINYRNDIIPIDNNYENRIISYLPSFDKNSWGYSGRSYYITIKTPEGGTVIKSIETRREHNIYILNNQELPPDEDENVENITDDFNHDSNFSLRTIHVKERTTSSGNEIRFIKLIFNDKENCLENQVYFIPSTFEYKYNGNIETFKINSYKGGDFIFGFIATSTYTKKRYLFVYQTSYKSLKMYDLNALNIINKSIFNINDCTIHSIVDDNVFLQFRDKILPIIIKTDIAKVIENPQFRLGEYDETLGWTGNIFSLWDKSQKQLNGFVNVFSEENDINKLNYKIKLYDKQINLVWESTLSNIKITDIHESEGFLIIGGFTMTQGYVGFPNPRVVVINKTTRRITYDNVIPLKNGAINNISSDINGNVEFTVDIWSAKKNKYQHFFLTPKIILDELDSNGKFVNDLFQMK